VTAEPLGLSDGPPPACERRWLEGASFPSDRVILWCNDGMPTAEASPPDSWGQDDNARRYEAFTREYPIYQEISRDLIGLARPAADAAVLDLACGTGVATREILAVLGPDGTVIGVDKSAAMLATAAGSVSDPRVSWVHARAENVAQHVSTLVDTAVCNSAIWQTDLAPTAAGVRAVMREGGCFAVNVPTDFLGDPDDPGWRVSENSVVSEMRAIAARDHGWAPEPRALRTRLTRESVCRFLVEAGFEVEQIVEFAHEESGESQHAWLKLPIFSGDQLRGLAYEDRVRIVDLAYERLGEGEAEQARWTAFLARAVRSPRGVGG
jgi:SAM-dependent methyltransferase